MNNSLDSVSIMPGCSKFASGIACKMWCPALSPTKASTSLRSFLGSFEAVFDLAGIGGLLGYTHGALDFAHCVQGDLRSHFTLRFLHRVQALTSSV
jgi:hypothetical protein